LLPRKKTLFTFTDKSGEKSNLTLDKWIADALSRMLDNVHAWIQAEYDRRAIGGKSGELSRRAIGDMIRIAAMKLAFSAIDESEL